MGRTLLEVGVELVKRKRNMHECDQFIVVYAWKQRERRKERRKEGGTDDQLVVVRRLDLSGRGESSNDSHGFVELSLRHGRDEGEGERERKLSG